MWWHYGQGILKPTLEKMALVQNKILSKLRTFRQKALFVTQDMVLKVTLKNEAQKGCRYIYIYTYTWYMAVQM